MPEKARRGEKRNCVHVGRWHVLHAKEEKNQTTTGRKGTFPHHITQANNKKYDLFQVMGNSYEYGWIRFLIFPSSVCIVALCHSRKTYSIFPSCMKMIFSSPLFFGKFIVRRECEKFAEEKFVSLTVSYVGMCGDGDSGGGHMMMNVSTECEPCSLRVCAAYAVDLGQMLIINSTHCRVWIFRDKLEKFHSRPGHNLLDWT